MDCVYEAYAEYMDYLGITVSGVDHILYRAMKYATHGVRPQYTFGGVVPWMYITLGKLHGLRLTMEHRVYSKDHHLIVADNKVQRFIIRHTDYGRWVRRFTLCPAIYLLLGQQHAVFSLTPTPTQGSPTAAFQFYDKRIIKEVSYGTN